MVSPAPAELFAFDNVANGAALLPAAESLPVGETYHSAACASAGATRTARAATSVARRHRRGLMRIRAFPFGETVEKFLASHDRIFVVEQNRDAQLRSLLTLETGVSKDKLHSILVYGGFPLSAKHVIEGVTSQLERS